MFTNAGMNQFKEYFLGNQEPKDNRITDTQKCLRVSGKHNDLEEVGHDTYHHTMFEMLGNWSFGDYFKKEAIEWSWELLTEVFQIPKDKLYVTVFEGDKEDGLGLDSEARDLWRKFVPEERILTGNKKDNFWEMGDQGPCGPCSEIHVDIRSDEERKKVSGADLVNKDHPLVIEIWNLVFMEFNRLADGNLKPLPNKHVDTGMGFERLCMVLQGKKSNYDTDVFQPLIQGISTMAKMPYGEKEEIDIAMRVISDHIRAISFAIADGQLPSNNKAGYVIRRILRRAVRYAYTFLNLQEPSMFRLVGVLADQMGEAFPELRKNQVLIANVVKEEEAAFLRTLEQGLTRIETMLEAEENLSGEQAFELYDTYGFPVDLIDLILRERGKKLDQKGFDQAMKAQKDRSRSDAKSTSSDWIEIQEGNGANFVGYDGLEAEVKVLKYRTVKKKDEERVQVVFNQTPFYPEGGGQVGDRGFISQGDEVLEVLDTRKENNLIIHELPEVPEKPNNTYKAKVNEEAREKSMKNHSATHLLHEALREVLGNHVEQKGSLVSPEYLRFDFSHFSKMSLEEVQRVESMVQNKILANLKLEEHRSIEMQKALDMGAMALFGEKYGDEVRVIKFGNSVELCGGTHVQATGSIGPFIISSESGIAAGIRRIEALTGEAAYAFINQKRAEVESIGALVKNPSDPVKGVENLVKEKKTLDKEVKALKAEAAQAAVANLGSSARKIDGINFLIEEVDMDPGALKNLAFKLEKDLAPAAIVLGGVTNNRPALVVKFSPDVVERKEWNAGKLIREIAKHIQGGGGGKEDFATAGGKNPDGMKAALSQANEVLK